MKTYEYSDQSFIIIIFLISLLVIILIRNWCQIKKNISLKQVIKETTLQLESYKLIASNLEFQHKSIELNDEKLRNKIYELENTLTNCKQKFYVTLKEKEKKIIELKNTIDYQTTSNERIVNLKNIEVNNTRLGDHFIKNIISQVYEDIEESGFSKFFGIHYKPIHKKRNILPLNVLKSIFKLLDYNVSTLNIDKITLNQELEHITMFLDLIKYLKPNTTIEFNNMLEKERSDIIKIKPTLLFPFIENALKHGSLNKHDSFISIVLKEKTDNELSYCLINSIDFQDNGTIKTNVNRNFGLNSLQQLLDVYYPKSNLFHKTLPNEQYFSEFTIKLN